MLKDVLDYTWARSKLLGAVAEGTGASSVSGTSEAVLDKAENLSRRLIELVSLDSYDHMKANLMLAREIAYWNEWLSITSVEGAISEETVSDIRKSIASFAAFEF